MKSITKGAYDRLEENTLSAKETEVVAVTGLAQELLELKQSVEYEDPTTDAIARVNESVRRRQVENGSSSRKYDIVKMLLLADAGVDLSRVVVSLQIDDKRFQELRAVDFDELKVDSILKDRFVFLQRLFTQKQTGALK